MQQRLFKEARLLLPAWLFTLLAMAAAWVFFPAQASGESVLLVLAWSLAR